MTCPTCQRDNPPAQNFCGHCGARLLVTCAACGAGNPPTQKFCGGCGQPLGTPASRAATPRSPGAYTPPHLAEKILTSKTALEGERKQVTVLFVDVSGFTSLSARLDPEEIHGIMARAFDLMLDEVHRHEGTINQFLGDGIMALFGAPIAHEDHARRAVSAALGIRGALAEYGRELERARAITFSVRQGLNTGLVVVGSIGKDLRMDYTAVGDTTNVAARLQQAAQPGQVVVGEATHRLADGYFHTRPLGPLTLKGKEAALAAWEVVSAREARTRLDVAAERGLTPFVGRGRELGTLAECYERARAGAGQVVFVAGEAGIGKSRLLEEFRRRVSPDVRWLEGHCLPVGRSSAFHPVIDLLRRLACIDEADSEEIITSKLDTAVLAVDGSLSPTVPYLRSLLSVDAVDAVVRTMDPQLRRRETFEALRRLLLRAPDTHPQVILIEDLHWVDPATEELLLFTVDSVPACRVLLVLTYRGGYASPFGERSYHTRLVPGALGPDESARMTHAMFATADLPDEVRTLVTRKAEGNPFFVEEVVRSLQETGAVRRVEDRCVVVGSLDHQIPDTIQGVIAARIDRLDEAPRRTLQIAAVIGRDFGSSLIERVADVPARIERDLRELKAVELIHEKQLFPELVYTFKHALTQEVAYGALLVQRRRDLHRTIGRAIEDAYADRLAEHYEMLADHFVKGEEWSRALDYLLKAADKAAAAYSSREAIALLDQALAVAPHVPALMPRALMAIHRTMSEHYNTLSDYPRSRTAAERFLEVARDASDEAMEAQALAATGAAAQMDHDFAGALAFNHRAVEVATRVGDGTSAARAHHNIGGVYAMTGRLDEATEELGRAVSMSRAAGATAVESFTLNRMGMVLGWQGTFGPASELTGQSLQIAREHTLLLPTLAGLWMHGLVLAGKGDYGVALTLLREGLPLAEKLGNDHYIARFMNTIGWVHAECEDFETAIETNRLSLQRARTSTHAVYVEIAAFSAVNLGDGLMRQGDLVLAREILEEARGTLEDPTTHEWMKWRYSIKCYLSLGELAVARGDLEAASGFAGKSMQIAEPTVSRKHIVRGWRLLGRIALAQRRWDDAESALRQAVALAVAVGNPPQLWQTHAALAELHAARGRHDAAREAFRAARQSVDRIKSSVEDPGLRAALDRSASLRSIVEASER